MKNESNKKFLEEKLQNDLLSENLIAANNAPNARIDYVDACVQVKNQISRYNYSELVDISEPAIQGVSDFHAGIIFGNELGLIVKGLRIRYACCKKKEFTTKNETILKLDFGHNRPVFLENSTICIMHDGRELLKLPINIIYGFGKLDHWFFLLGERFTNIIIKAPRETSNYTEDDTLHFVEVSLLGDAIVRY